MGFYKCQLFEEHNTRPLRSGQKTEGASHTAGLCDSYGYTRAGRYPAGLHNLEDKVEQHCTSVLAAQG